MSTKTIALAYSVYQRLARQKRESESFTKTISRLIVARLRQAHALSGRSHSAFWIAATAHSHGARILTQNTANFTSIPGLELVAYG